MRFHHQILCCLSKAAHRGHYCASCNTVPWQHTHFTIRGLKNAPFFGVAVFFDKITVALLNAFATRTGRRCAGGAAAWVRGDDRVWRYSSPMALRGLALLWFWPLAWRRRYVGGVAFFCVFARVFYLVFQKWGRWCGLLLRWGAAKPRLGPAYGFRVAFPVYPWVVWVEFSVFFFYFVFFQRFFVAEWWFLVV